MKLKIVSPNSFAEYSVSWVEFNTPTGNYVIQEGHVPMIAIISPSQPIIFRLKSGKQESIIVKQGVAEITRHETTIIIS